MNTAATHLSSNNATHTTATHTTARIAALQAVLTQRQLHACTVFSADPHLSEYLPEHWQGRAWLSGFHGSAGTLVVTRSEAALWTDSRYWEQAEHDLRGTGIALMRAGAPDVPQPANWLVEVLQGQQQGNETVRVAVDGMTLSVNAFEDARATFAQADIVLETGIDFLGEVWAQRPPLPHAPVFEHPMPFACRTRAQKLAAVRKVMAADKVDAKADSGAGLKTDWHWISALDDIAWLLNLRGADVPYNPVFLAHMLIGPGDVRLFVDAGKISATLTHRLRDDGIVIRPYEEARAALHTLPETDTVWLDPDRVVAGIALGMPARALHLENPSQLLKACKLESELDFIRATMVQDGAALCEFFAWFEQQMEQKARQSQEASPQSQPSQNQQPAARQPITELTVDEQITAARARREHFISPSFATIAAFNANGAMPHYQATPTSHAVIEGDGLLLIDSGGQYLGGTTDITRVLPVGKITPVQKEDFTRVLKGMIALSCAVFPEETSGALLDVLARQPLWREGLDYGHGTGHGVGYFINVHEGPQSIAWRAKIHAGAHLRVGMVTSNEPGLYRPGQWGIRIENLVACMPAQFPAQRPTQQSVQQPNQDIGFGRFLRFETLTLCPIDTRCIDVSLLDGAEVAWLNDYHATVRERLLPHVSGAARQWLERRTRKLKKSAPERDLLQRWLRRRAS